LRDCNEKAIFLIATVAIILVISLALYYFIDIYPKTHTIPDDKGFIPVHIYFENDMRNITLTPDSSASINVTLTSNLYKEITVTIKHSLAALNNPPGFNATLQPNPLILKVHGTNSTILTIHIAEDVPPDIQPDALVLELESTQYPNVRLWSVRLQIDVKSPSK
jgi:hypothetical protein